MVDVGHRRGANEYTHYAGYGGRGFSSFIVICISINTAVALMMGKTSNLVKREILGSRMTTSHNVRLLWYDHEVVRSTPIVMIRDQSLHWSWSRQPQFTASRIGMVCPAGKEWMN